MGGCVGQGAASLATQPPCRVWAERPRSSGSIAVSARGPCQHAEPWRQPARTGRLRAMRVLVTGANGFVGGWLTSELASAGHEVVPFPAKRDVRDTEAVRRAVDDAAPEAVVHLAAVSFAPDAAADPDRAFEVAVTGTINVIEAIRRQPQAPALLVSGSSEVYGSPAPGDLPLTESSRLSPGHAIRAVEGGPGSRRSRLRRATRPARCGNQVVQPHGTRPASRLCRPGSRAQDPRRRPRSGE